MTTIRTARALAAIATSLSLLVPAVSMAREGAQSVGKGIKCYQAVTQNADGSYSLKQICYKSI